MSNAHLMEEPEKTHVIIVALRTDFSQWTNIYPYSTNLPHFAQLSPSASSARDDELLIRMGSVVRLKVLT